MYTVYTYIHTYIHADICVYNRSICVSAGVWMCVDVCVCVCVRVCVCVCVQVRVSAGCGCGCGRGGVWGVGWGHADRYTGPQT